MKKVGIFILLKCTINFVFDSSSKHYIKGMINRFIIIINLGCIFTFLISCCKPTNRISTIPNNKLYSFRLLPGQGLRAEIENFVQTKQIKAGWIATCVGSFTTYHIRFANQQKGVQLTGHFEIVSLTGTLSTNGSHMHISISDSTGKTIGGHLLKGCVIYTTEEIVIQSSNNFVFKRQKDGTTPYDELKIEMIKN